MTDLKKRVMCWPSTIFGGITILYALFEISHVIPENMLIFMIGRMLTIICGIVFVCSKL